MKVLGIGESVIDNVYRIPGDSRPAKNVGGPVLIGLILLARLGVECTFVTSVGRDENAEIINQLLKHEKVRLIPKYQHKTKVNTIFVDNKTGQREKIRGPVKHASIKNLNRKFLHQFDLILIDRHEKLAFYEIIQKKKAGTKIVIDPSTEFSLFTLDMIKYSDYPIIPIDALTPTNSLEKIEKALEQLYIWCHKTIIITASDAGSLIYNGISTETLPPLRIKAIDTTGAGDIYRGGFAYGILKGWGIKTSARYANIVSGLQCMKMGNASAIPTKKEINAYISSLQAIPKLSHLNTRQ